MRPAALSGSLGKASGAIGIFDSGVGGLTVLKALKDRFPQESFLYLGDTARLPYGTKSPETIVRYLKQNMDFMKRRGIKALVVACNTASTALGDQHLGALPVFGVVEPGALAARKATKSGRVGVLGTAATVASGAYVKALKALDTNLQVVQAACPLLVPLVEEGWEEDPVTRQVLQRYLVEPLEAEVDTLILGCTHYPVLKPVIQEIVGPAITLVDSAEEIANRLWQDLHEGRIDRDHAGTLRVLTTDISPAFKRVGARILNPYQADAWEWADIGEQAGT